jgi:hypothetical protein
VPQTRALGDGTYASVWRSKKLASPAPCTPDRLHRLLNASYLQRSNGAVPVGGGSLSGRGDSLCSQCCSPVRVPTTIIVYSTAASRTRFELIRTATHHALSLRIRCPRERCVAPCCFSLFARSCLSGCCCRMRCCGKPYVGWVMGTSDSELCMGVCMVSVLPIAPPMASPLPPMPTAPTSPRRDSCGWVRVCVWVCSWVH